MIVVANLKRDIDEVDDVEQRAWGKTKMQGNNI